MRLASKNLENAFEFCVNIASRTIILSGDIRDGAFKQISLALSELERLSTKKEITIEINSEGGIAYEALAIVGRMKNSPCKIRTQGFGQIMSAATIIMAAGDVREMNKYAWVMHHSGRVAIRGSVPSANNQLIQFNREEAQWSEILQDLTGTPKEKWNELSGTDTYLTAEQCIELGLIDKII